MKKAVVILPTYNERENIERTVRALEKVFPKINNWQMHILVVDDTSPDGTYLEVKKLQKEFKNLHLFLNKKKAGLGGAYLKGMAEAFDNLKADVVFEFDADLQHPAEKVPEFLKKIDAGDQLVLGTRYQMGGSIPKTWGWHRKLLSRMANLLVMTVMTDFSIRDWTSGFRAVKKEVYEAVHPYLHSERFSGYTFQIGFLYNALRKGFKIGLVPYAFFDRTYGHSKIGPEYIKNTLMYIFKVRLQELLTHRLFKFAVVGGIGALVQFVTLALFRPFMAYVLAYFLSAEMAVGSNFIWSNLWTFSDRKLKAAQIPAKFITFNLASFGSVGIQTVLAWVGERTIGADVALFKVPFSQLILGKSFIFDTGFLFMIVGILVGMIWNYLAYSRVIWKAKKK